MLKQSNKGSFERKKDVKTSQKAQWINKHVFHMDSVFKHKIQDNYPANKARINVRDDFNFNISPNVIYIYNVSQVILSFN